MEGINTSKSNNKKTLFYILCLQYIVCIFATFFDKEIVLPNLYKQYVIIQIIYGTICAILQYRNYKKYEEINLFLFKLTILTYGCVCQFFIPGSFYTVLIGLLGFYLLLDMNSIKYRYVNFCYTTVSILCIWLSPASYSLDPIMTEKFKMDASQTILMITLCIIIVQKIKFKNWQQTKLLEGKLLNLGNQTINIVHDLKNQITPPLNNIMVLEKMLAKLETADPLLKEICEETKNNLLEMREYVLNINQINSFKTEVVKINFEEILNNVYKSNHNKMQDVDILAIKHSTPNLTCDIHIIKSIITNVIMNSVQNFNNKKTQYKSITMETYKGKLLIKDNGGGFDEKAIKNFNDDTFFSDKAEGSGIGFFIIKRYAESLNWKVSLYNTPNNEAVIEFKF